jgi:hypothetical protein
MNGLGPVDDVWEGCVLKSGFIGVESVMFAAYPRAVEPAGWVMEVLVYNTKCVGRIASLLYITVSFRPVPPKN